MEAILQSMPVFAAALLAILMAGLVLRRGRQDRRHQLLALFLFFLAVSWGGFALSRLLGGAGPEASTWSSFWLAYSYFWFPGLPLSALWLAVATRARPPPFWTHPAVVCVAVAAYALTLAIRPEAYGSDPVWGGGIVAYATWGVTGALGIVPLVFLRRARRALSAPERSSHLLLGVGLATATVFHAARELFRFVAADAARPTSLAGWGVALFFLVYAIATMIFVGALWHARERSPPDLRGPLRVAAVVVTVQAASGFAAAAARSGLFPLSAEAAESLAVGLWAIWMFAAPAILAYAILRGKVLGLDTRVRRGVRRGTIASAFVAVFFVASEGAQQIFAVGTGPWIGLLAAGALVFAMAPLQRVAERVADAAVPHAAPSAVDGLPASKEEAYRNALRLALRDRRLTREEEVQLMHLADELGLSARRALEIRHALDTESSSEPATSAST